MSKKNKNKGGRPKSDLDEKDWKILDGFILWSDLVDCSSKLNISESTLKRRIKEKYKTSFEQFRKQKRLEMKQNLRLKQYQIAMNGNVPMLIWLGKNELNQKDKQDIEHSGEFNIDIQFVPKTD